MQRKLVFAGACVLLLSISGLQSWYVKLQRLYFYDTTDISTSAQLKRQALCGDNILSAAPQECIDSLDIRGGLSAR